MKINFDNFVQKRRYFYIFSSVILLLGVVAMIWAYATTGSFLRLSVDFLGGTRFEEQFTEPVTEEQIREVFESFGLSNPSVTAIRGQDLQNAWQIRTAFVTTEEAAAALAAGPDIGDTLITHRFPLDACTEAFATAADRASGTIKVAFDI